MLFNIFNNKLLIIHKIMYYPHALYTASYENAVLFILTSYTVCEYILL